MIEIVSHSNLDNKYFQSVTHGVTVGSGRLTRPAETNSHIVISRGPQTTFAYFVGPWASATELKYESDAEIIWIKLKLGAHIKRTPSVIFQNTEYIINPSSIHELSLDGQVFKIPSECCIDGFLDLLVRSHVLDFDPLISESLGGNTVKIPERTLRYRFLSAVGLSRESIFQIQRIGKAATLLSKGAGIAEAALSLGYYDQSHLTRNFKKYLGRTPGMAKYNQTDSG